MMKYLIFTLVLFAGTAQGQTGVGPAYTQNMWNNFQQMQSQRRIQSITAKNQRNWDLLNNNLLSLQTHLMFHQNRLSDVNIKIEQNVPVYGAEADCTPELREYEDRKESSDYYARQKYKSTAGRNTNIILQALGESGARRKYRECVEVARKRQAKREADTQKAREQVKELMVQMRTHQKEIQLHEQLLATAKTDESGLESIDECIRLDGEIFCKRQ